MFERIKNKIDAELKNFVSRAEKTYPLQRLSPLLARSIKDFVLRDGKRIRPILFVIGYLGFAKKPAKRLYTSAVAIELLHDFLLVHDDIIDKSPTRRGKPTMHVSFNHYLTRYPKVKFNGQDLSIIAGDVMYAMAIDAFLAIQENLQRKENALRNFVKAAMLTGGGEFIELLSGTQPLNAIAKKNIYTIYDYKTAHYTFVCPLTTGALLAGAPQPQLDKLFDYGMCVGRAFQIKDDILGIFGNENKIGKSTLSDLQEAKKTILIWHAYHQSDNATRRLIQKVFSKNKVTKNDLLMMRRIIEESGALDFAKKEIAALRQKANAVILSSGIKRHYRDCLSQYARELLSL